MTAPLGLPGALLLCLSLVLFVYRFSVAGVNLSLFRVVFLAWLAILCVDMVRGRVRPERRYVPFAALVSGLLVVNLIDFLTLGGYPALRRDIANHMVNLALAGLVLVYVKTEMDRLTLLRAFVWSSVLTTAVTVHAGLFDRVPFEWALRSRGSELGQALAYISDDTFFVRATSSFFDPNFYGIYSMLVLVAIVYLWLFDGPRRSLAVLCAVNLACLALTLSRTAIVGLLVALGVVFLLSRRARPFAVVMALATVGSLYAATAFQSHVYFDQSRDRIEAWWEDWRRSDAPAGQPGAAGGGPAAPRAATPSPRERAPDSPQDLDNVASRMTSARSLENRLDYITRGLAVFRASPIWGGGSAVLVTADNPWSSAHVSYLTLLARYGVLGTLVYLAFLLYPLAIVWRRGADPRHRFLVTTALVPLMVVYLSYDVFLFFEIQYVFFGLAYSAAEHARANRRRGDVIPGSS